MQEKLYLIKSAFHVSGPFQEDEVLEKIRSKKISGFDEVTAPNERWTFLRDHAHFGPLLKKIIQNLNQDEGSYDVTSTLDKTQYLREKTKTLTDSAVTAKNNYGTADDLEEYKQEAMDVEVKNSQAGKSEVIRVGSKSSYRKVKKKKRFWEYGIPLLIAVSLLAYLFLYEDSIETHTTTAVMDIKLEANNLSYLGKYNELELLLRNKLAASDWNDSFKILMANIYIKNHKDVDAMRILEDLQETIKDNKMAAEVENALGLIAIRQQNLEEAKSHFEKSLLLQPKFEQASFNLVDTYLLMDNIAKAKENFPQQVLLESSMSTKAFLQLELAYDDILQNKDSQSLQEVRRIIQDLSQNWLDQKPEIFQMAGLIEYEMGNIEEGNSLLTMALQINPTLFSRHVQDLFLYHPDVVHQKLLVLFKKNEYRFQTEPEFLASLGLLHLWNKSNISARKYLDKAYQMDTQNRDIEVLLNFISGQKFTDNEDDFTQLEWIFKAEKCEETKDFTCASRIWQQVLQGSPSSLEAVAGMGRQYLRENKKTELKNTIAKGLGISPRFIPYRVLELSIGDKP